jgi:hypothetical protein
MKIRSGFFPETTAGETDMPGAVPNNEVDDTETIGVGFYCNRPGSTIRGQMVQNVAPRLKVVDHDHRISLVTCLGNQDSSAFSNRRWRLPIV